MIIPQKPTYAQPNWNPDDANVAPPSSGKQSTGFILNEILGSKINNWFWRSVSQYLKYAVELGEGLATSENFTVTIDSEQDFDDLMDFFNFIHKVNHTITINGTYGMTSHVEKSIVLNGVSGSGEIRWNYPIQVDSLFVNSSPVKLVFEDLTILKPWDSFGISSQGITNIKFNTLFIEQTTIIPSEEIGKSLITNEVNGVLDFSNTVFNINRFIDQDHIQNYGTIIFRSGNSITRTGINPLIEHFWLFNRGKIIGPRPSYSTDDLKLPLNSPYVPKGWELEYDTFAGNKTWLWLSNVLEEIHGKVILSQNPLANSVLEIKNISGSGELVLNKLHSTNDKSIVFRDITVPIKIREYITGSNSDSALTGNAWEFIGCNVIESESDGSPAELRMVVTTSSTAGRSCFRFRNCNRVNVGFLTVPVASDLVATTANCTRYMMSERVGHFSIRNNIKVEKDFLNDDFYVGRFRQTTLFINEMSDVEGTGTAQAHIHQQMSVVYFKATPGDIATVSTVVERQIPKE